MSLSPTHHHHHHHHQRHPPSISLSRQRDEWLSLEEGRRREVEPLRSHLLHGEEKNVDDDDDEDEKDAVPVPGSRLMMMSSSVRPLDLSLSSLSSSPHRPISLRSCPVTPAPSPPARAYPRSAVTTTHPQAHAFTFTQSKSAKSSRNASPINTPRRSDRDAAFNSTSSLSLTSPVLSEQDDSLVAASVSGSVSASAQLTRCQQVLSTGHVFTQHILSGSVHSSKKVLVFCLHNTLYACEYHKGQTKYSKPFFCSPLTGKITVFIGKQTPALRLDKEAPDRRCVAIAVQSPPSSNSSSSDSLIELEAPGSGDLKYWLRTLFSLLTLSESFTVNDNLFFVQSTPVDPDTQHRVELRIRQARIDGQHCRRKEEQATRGSPGIRIKAARRWEEQSRQHQQEEKSEHWARLHNEAAARVYKSGVSTVDKYRLSAIDRIKSVHNDEYQKGEDKKRGTAAAPSRTTSTFSFSNLHLNKRSTVLQTHVNPPVLQSAWLASDGQHQKPLSASKSQPNLQSAAATGKAHTEATIDSPSAAAVVSPPHTLRQLSRVMPQAVNAGSASSSSLSNPSTPLHRALPSVSLSSPAQSTASLSKQLPLTPPAWKSPSIAASITGVGGSNAYASPAQTTPTGLTQTPSQTSALARSIPSISASKPTPPRAMRTLSFAPPPPLLSYPPVNNESSRYVASPPTFMSALPTTNVYQMQHEQVVMPQAPIPTPLTDSKLAASMPEHTIKIKTKEAPLIPLITTVVTESDNPSLPPPPPYTPRASSPAETMNPPTAETVCSSSVNTTTNRTSFSLPPQTSSISITLQLNERDARQLGTTGAPSIHFHVTTTTPLTATAAAAATGPSQPPSYNTAMHGSISSPTALPSPLRSSSGTTNTSSPSTTPRSSALSGHHQPLRTFTYTPRHA